VLDVQIYDVGINLVIHILVCLAARPLFRRPRYQFSIPDSRIMFLSS